MLVNKVVQLAVLAAALLWESRSAGAPSAVKLCGRKLSEIMSRVCHHYNSPPWDVPTVIEQPGVVVRRKRQVGIADECCTYGCTLDQLTEYCSITVSDTLLDGLDAHMIADRSAETEAVPRAAASAPAPAAPAQPGPARREVGRARARRRCRCRRRRRSGRRRASLMGNMVLIKNAARAAPVVGTVSPLLTWGRTLNTDLPQVDRDRYAYVAVYST